MYTKEEVFLKTLEYFKGDELATDVFLNKYCLRDRYGNYLEKTPDDMHRRLAKEFARIEQNYPNPLIGEEIYDLLKDFKYIVPQGSPMYGIGNNETLTSLSNCFVIGNNNNSDSYGSIMRSDEEQIQIMKRRGGVGQDISHLRPKGVIANGKILQGDTGASLYMERFSNSTREVAQDNRRGALLLSIDVRHPDTDLFIDKKLKQGKVTGANISVKVTDEFMKAVKDNSVFFQRFPIGLNVNFFEYRDIDEDNSSLPFDKILDYEDPDGNIGYVKKIHARKLWNKIIKNAHSSAEPGVLFWDTAKKESPSDRYGEDWEIHTTNPCGEINLNPYDACRLLAINLYSYIENPFTAEAKFNFSLFKKHVNIAQRLMDDIVDLEIEKLDKIIDKINNDRENQDIKKVEKELWQKIRQKTVQGRRTGLGITGEGDMLAALGLKYGTKEATEFSVGVHRILAIESYKSSIEMAKERGCFPIFNYEKENINPFINRIEEQLSWNKLNELDDEYFLMYKKYGRRNIANLTIAPTGSVSTLTQTSSGIEPCFQVYYLRRRKVNPEDKNQKIDFIDETGDHWQEYKVFHHKFIEWWRVNFAPDHTYQAAFLKLQQLKDQEIEELIEESPYHQATSNDIDWKESVKMQGMIQKWVDHSISKTINLPKDTTIDLVNDLYLTAYEEGCKGVTIYRDGSRSGVLVSNKKTEDGFQYSDALKRPKELSCDIYHKTALKEQWTVLVGLYDNKPYEIFVIPQLSNIEFPHKLNKGKLIKNKSRYYTLKGKDKEKEYCIENIVEYMSMDERANTRKYSLMLRHKIDPKFIVEQIREYASITSFDKVIERVLFKYIDEEIKEQCPDCGNDLIMTEGCMKCNNCSYSKCG